MIIELQGTLETKEDVSLEGKAIGDLHFDAKVRCDIIIFYKYIKLSVEIRAAHIQIAGKTLNL